LDCLTANGRMITERIEVCAKKFFPGLFADIVMEFSWQDCGRRRRRSVSIAGRAAEIRARNPEYERIVLITWPRSQ